MIHDFRLISFLKGSYTKDFRLLRLPGLILTIQDKTEAYMNMPLVYAGAYSRTSVKFPGAYSVFDLVKHFP